MRIIAGRLRGLGLAPVGRGDAAAHLRPTSDRVRESLFNLLAHGGDDPITGARVLDLFAGTGALGLEALSRGAEAATFVETGRAALALLRRNIALTRSEAAARVLPRDATRLPPGMPHDLVFLDPPYGKGLGQQALAAAGSGGWLAPGALIVLEEGAAMPAPPGFRLVDLRRYGGTHLHLMRADHRQVG